jgi:GTPase SAR1 family protein
MEIKPNNIKLPTTLKNVTDIDNFKLPMKCLIHGIAGCGKTHLTVRLISEFQNTFSHVYIYSGNNIEPLHDWLKTQLDPSLLTIAHNTDSLTSFMETHQKQKYDRNNRKQTLHIFDDVKHDKCIDDFVMRSRKMDASVIYVKQSYFDIPKIIRYECGTIITMKFLSYRSIKAITLDCGLQTQARELCDIYCDELKEIGDSIILNVEHGTHCKNFDNYLLID